jgi:hypothetical protein
MADIPIIEGDILDMAGKGSYIVQQCCCVSTYTAGLSAAIARKWPALNPYKTRRAVVQPVRQNQAPQMRSVGKSRRATLNTRDSPGTAEVFSIGGGVVNLVCLYAQYGPGKPSIYEDAEVQPFADTADARLKFFKDALEDAATMIKDENPTLYFPYRIGCGLAGGNWPTYHAALKIYARTHPEYNVVIVKLPARTE